MFTGIIEAAGEIVSVKNEKGNLVLTVNCSFTSELKPGQSIAHNGVCLTVSEISGDDYTVVAIDETLKRTNLGSLGKGDLINLERAMKIGDRIDGHLVQGHVDSFVTCQSVTPENGSFIFKFSLDPKDSALVVEKGSVCLNGVSLTVVEAAGDHFSVAVIPFTLENTNFKTIKTGNSVNVEFDILGKYVEKQLSGFKESRKNS